MKDFDSGRFGDQVHRTSIDLCEKGNLLRAPGVNVLSPLPCCSFVAAPGAPVMVSTNAGQQITADTAAIQKALEERRASRPRALLYCCAKVEEETLFSEQYGRVRSRVSYCILVVCNIAGVDMPYIARIRWFVKLSSGQVTTDGASTNSETRMAICSLTRARKEGDLYVTDRS